jgi:hypothetical protein
MMQINVGENLRRRNFLQRLQHDKFYSVEFMVNGLPYLFQFKIWNTPSKQMFILVKESSDILNRIKEGESFNMKYYSSVLDYPIALKTKIDYITKEKNGRFKNHYLVGLKILQDQQ